MVLSLHISPTLSFYLASGLGKHCSAEQRENEGKRFLFFFIMSLKNTNWLEECLLALLLEITSGILN